MISFRLHHALLLLALTTFSLAPMSTASAALTRHQQIARNLETLRLLRYETVPTSTVTRLVLRLVTLDPLRAARYLRLGITSLGHKQPIPRTTAKKLAARTIETIKAANLPARETEEALIGIRVVEIKTGLLPIPPLRPDPNVAL